MDEIKATPRNVWLGKLADALRKGNDFAAKPFGYDNPPGEYISEFIGIPSLATTLDRLSYGEPLTNIGKANVPLLRPETAEAVMAIAPMAVGSAKALIKASPQAQAAALRMMDNANAPTTLNKQAGVVSFNYFGLPNRGRDQIRENAETLAEAYRAKGWNPVVEHSGSAAGPSSYVYPNYRIGTPLRFSNHSKGVFNNQEVENVFDVDAFNKIIENIPEAPLKTVEQIPALERIASSARPQVFQANKIAEGAYEKAFSNSGKYLGPKK